jgi:predicted permease
MGTLVIEGRPFRLDRMVDTRVVTAQYFEAIGTLLIAGRFLTEADRDGRTAVVIVNETFERQYFPGESALGKRISPSTPMMATIVGVVADVRHDNLEDAPRPQAYTPMLAEGPPDGLFLAVATRASAGATAQAIRSVLRQLDPMLALGGVRVMSERVSEASALRRFHTVLLTVFAVVAIAIAGIGLYGLIAYTVRQRTMEIGIRLSLGASGRNILMLVLRQGLWLSGLGVVVGIGGSLAVTRLMASTLYGVAPTDPTAFGVVSVVLVSIGLLASYIPARRATRVDPIIALRAE